MRDHLKDYMNDFLNRYLTDTSSWYLPEDQMSREGYLVDSGEWYLPKEAEYIIPQRMGMVSLSLPRGGQVSLLGEDGEVLWSGPVGEEPTDDVPMDKVRRIVVDSA